jgi:hypothetical protein
VDWQLRIASKLPIHFPEHVVEVITFSLVLYSFHHNLASRVIPRYLVVLAYGTFVPLMKIDCCLILLFVKSMCTYLDSLSFIRHVMFSRRKIIEKISSLKSRWTPHSFHVIVSGVIHAKSRNRNIKNISYISMYAIYWTNLIFLDSLILILFSDEPYTKLRLTTVGDPPRWQGDTPLSTNVDTKFRRQVAVDQSV